MRRGASSRATSNMSRRKIGCGSGKARRPRPALTETPNPVRAEPVEAPFFLLTLQRRTALRQAQGERGGGDTDQAPSPIGAAASPSAGGAHSPELLSS